MGVEGVIPYSELNLKQAEYSIAAAGVNHNTAPVELREQIAFQANELADAMRALKAECGLSECAVLSTCNRSEVYAVGPAPSTEEILQFLAVYHGADPAGLVAHSYHLRGDEAVTHLGRVACGLDSMVIGEHQILGQVKQAA
jgi:glutamyl-tRNA reductase